MFSIFYLLSALLSFFSFGQCLQCYSTLCHDPDEHGFCTQTCSHPDQACYGSFFITPNGTVIPGTFMCHTVKEEECQATSCQVGNMTSSFAHCCCRKDLCSIIPGLFGDNTPAPPIINPTPPVQPPLVPGNQLVCEFNNCTSSSNTLDCYHGYEICADHHSTDTVSSSPSDHFCAVHARRTSSGHYELQSMGCIITTNLRIHQLGVGQSNCTLDTLSRDNHISCYCDQLYCSSGTNLHFTDASRFLGPTGDILCDGGCSHSCVISGGSPRCLCRVGYALDMDLMTCVDINECLDPHSHQCSHICVNMEGSYRCDCPPDSGLRLASNGTHCEPIPGLVCARHDRNCTSSDCNSISYCDRVLGPLHDPEREVCIAVMSYEDGEFTIQYQSCFISALHEPCEPGKCVLQTLPGSRSSIYKCCCRGMHVCNTKFIYPDLNATSTTPLLPMTTMDTTGTDGEVSTTPVPSPDEGLPLARWTLFVLAILPGTIIVLVVFTILVIVIALACREQSCFNKRSNDDTRGVEIGDSAPRPIQLLSRATHFENPPISSGKFSKIYEEEVERESRAVKVFKRQNIHYYNRELSIYNLPNLRHPNILLFISSREYLTELHLIFEYHPMGSLYDVLNKHAISTRQFCDIATSAAKGLAHLHTEVIKDGVLVKPCIAHRDLKSKNILIKSDMRTAIIADLGLGIKWPIEVATDAQSQVGTVRYLPPEVLEAAVSFDREAYLRIDIYSFTLIVWELTTRTETTNGSVTEYRPPFDEMVPSIPSINDMKSVVVDCQKRPVIPKAFTNNPDMFDVVYIIQEGWDTDAEARLTAHCIYEHLIAFTNKLEGSGFSPGAFDTTGPPGSPTDIANSETSTTPTRTRGAAVPLGDPNTATHFPRTNSDQSEVSQHQATLQHNVMGGVGPCPPPGGGKPHDELSPTIAGHRFGSAPALSRGVSVTGPTSSQQSVTIARGHSL